MEEMQPEEYVDDVWLESAKISLEAIKEHLFQSIVSNFQVSVQSNPLIDVVKSSFTFVCNTNETNLHSFVYQVKYIRSTLQVLKLFSADLACQTGVTLAKYSGSLISSIFQQYTVHYANNAKDKRIDFIQGVIFPAFQLVNDCLEVNTTAVENIEKVFKEVSLSYLILQSHLNLTSKLISELGKFAISPEGLSLERSHFMRVLALCQRLAKFMENVTIVSNKLGTGTDGSTERLSHINVLENLLCSNISTILATENGRSFVKVWCEHVSSSSKEGNTNIPKFLSHIHSADEFPEVYLILTRYISDGWFWKTTIGRSLTPILISTIQKDLLSTDKSKVETRKRAAFILKGITSMYSVGNPLFDPDVFEVAIISLNHMEQKKYVKFWAHFFDLYETLNETQLHIVQPVLCKLAIFKENSNNESVFAWFPVILTKMIIHDNRVIVKEGLECFLSTGQYFALQKANTYRHVAAEFFDKYIMTLIKDHVGWVLNEPGDYFKNVYSCGTFLTQLYSNHSLSHFIAMEKILSFLTSTGKCMSSHAVFFFISTLESVLTQNDYCTFSSKLENDDEKQQLNNRFCSCLESCLSLIALLMSNSVTTISKYFREQAEKLSINVILQIAPFVSNYFPELSIDEPIFIRLLYFLGSISTKIIYKASEREKVEMIIEMYMEKIHKSFQSTLSSGALIHKFAKDKLNNNTISVLGLFRFLRIGFKTINRNETDLLMVVEEYAELCCRQELLNGSVQGLREFFEVQIFSEPPKWITDIDNQIARILGSSITLTSGELLNCIQRLLVLSTVKDKPTLLGKFDVNKVSVDSPAKLFIFQIFHEIRISHAEQYESIYRLLVSKFPLTNSGNFEVFEEVSGNYFDMTDRNLVTDFYQINLLLLMEVINRRSELEEQTQLLILEGVLDKLEICDPKGIAAGLRLAKAVVKFVYQDQENLERILSCLQNIASLSWSLVFDLRKNESFWQGLEAFVEFICDPIFVTSGDLNKYADLIFEEAKMVWGLLYAFVKQLVKVKFPSAILDQVNNLLVKAALAGGLLPKNHRMSFSLWDYLRTEKGCSLGDPENFSSDCKARILACERLHNNVRFLVMKDETKVRGEELLYKVVASMVEINDAESISRKRYFGSSLTHRLKQRIFQCLLILQPHFNFEISKFVLGKTLSCLSTDSPQPSVRYLGEWLVVRIIERHPNLQNIFFECLDECIHTRVGFGAFFATICLHLSKVLLSIEFYDQALQSLTTLILSQHLTVRIYSQIAFQNIFMRTKQLEFVSLVEKYSPVRVALQAALAYVSGNCSKLLENLSHDFYANTFDVKEHYSPEVIFCLLPRLAGMSKDECILQPGLIQELCPSLYGSEVKIDTGILTELYAANGKSAWHLKSIVADGRELGEERPNIIYSNPKRNSNEAEDEEMSNYQKKINPWKLLSVSDEIADYKIFSMNAPGANTEGLIVVASLLENLPNLGGLCRTCEIFGVEKYVVNTLKVINEIQFQNLSVSAQNWVNILEVPVRDLKTFLLTYAAKGYSILGVEQANESCSLANFVFPKKTVLLLGNEKQGIPTELLTLVDTCIEIPQFGIIRSLNVHVTGALCIWQYAAQNIISDR